MRIIFTGGGSGGHVVPNIAIFEMLVEKGHCRSEDLLYVGTNTEFERSILSGKPIAYAGIACGKLRRYFSLQNLFDLFKTALGIAQSFFIISRFKPDLIFAKGGYVSLPVVLAGWLKRVPVVIHESDVHPGLANRISAVFADVVCISSEETREYFKSDKITLTGIPLRSDLCHGNRDHAKKLTGLNNDSPVILFMGGGKGDPFINSLVSDNLSTLLAEYQVIHLGGSTSKQDVKTNTDTLNLGRYARYSGFNDEIPDVYALADLIVSRAGASTLAEIAELKKPCILIPMAKGCSRGEQLLNAKIFSKNNDALILEEAESVNSDWLSLIRTQLKSFQSSARPVNANTVPATDVIIQILLNIGVMASARKNKISVIASVIFQKICGMILSILCLPICLIISVLIASVDGLPVLFTQERIGRNRKKFRLYKFRTLQDGEETIMGHWLRATGLDELPQLINVMKSDMNLVGPRPLTEQDVIRLGWDDRGHDKRFEVEPGITGLGQLSTVCDKELTWRLDTSYIQSRSILLDVKILAMSAMVGILGKKILK